MNPSNIPQAHRAPQAVPIFDAAWLGATPKASPATSAFAQTLSVFQAAGLGCDLRPCAPPHVLKTKRGSDGSKIPCEFVDGRWRPMTDWRMRQPTVADYETWCSYPNAGACLVTRQIRAIDIDIKFNASDTSAEATTGRSLVAAILSVVRGVAGVDVPLRTREGSSSCAALVAIAGPLTKRAIRITNGLCEHKVEILADGQQIVVGGRHVDGGAVRTTLAAGVPVPTIDVGEVPNLLAAIADAARGAGYAVDVERAKAPTQDEGPITPQKAVERAIWARRADWLPSIVPCDVDMRLREWRISSEALHRDLEEDLSVYPNGAFDHGTERSHSPLSVIIEFGAVSGNEIVFGGAPEYGPRNGQPFAVIGESDFMVVRPTRLQAARWLCRSLGGTAAAPTCEADILPRLAGAAGLQWSRLCSIHDARYFEIDGVKGLGSDRWSESDVRTKNALLPALRAIDPNAYSALRSRHPIVDELTAAAALLPDTLADTTVPASTSPPHPISGPIDPRTIPTRRWLIMPRLVADTVTLAVGEPGVSKSTFMLATALAIATGDESILRGKGAQSPERLHRTGPVIVYNAEDSLNEMRRRLSVLQQHHGVSQMAHTIHLWSGVDGASLTIAHRQVKAGPVVRAPGADILSKSIRDTGAILTILDPLVSLSAGLDENSTDDMNALMDLIVREAAASSTTILVVHHTAKGTRNNAGDMGAGRGAFSIAAKARGQFTLCPVDAKDAEAWGVAGRDVFRMDYGKSSYGARSHAPLLFERKSVAVGNGSTTPASDDMLPPEQMLQLRGDTAPVLEFLKVGTAAEAAEAKAQKETGRRALVAGAIYDAIGGLGSRALGDVWPEIAAALKASGVSKASGRSTITGLLRAELVEPVLIERDGQNVRVTIDQAGMASTSPFFVHAKVVGQDVRGELVGLHEEADREDRQDGKH